MRSVLRQYWPRTLTAYALFLVETVLRLAQPIVLGVAVNGVLNSQIESLYWFAGFLATQSAITFIRATLDTRTFAAIVRDVSILYLKTQEKCNTDLSQLAARTTFVREFVAFLERDVTAMIGIALMLIGSVAMLFSYEVCLGLASMLVLLVVFGLGHRHSKTCEVLQRQLNNQLEQEVQVIEKSCCRSTAEHYAVCALLRVQLSDASAKKAWMLEGLTAALAIAALAILARPERVNPGDLVAMFRYLTLFAASVANMPMLLQQIARLRDIQKRL